MTLTTLLGLAGATLTTISFLPQVMQVLKTKHTKDLSLTMYIILVLGIVLWLVYGILVADLPVIAANGVTLVLASLILVMKLRYK